MTKSLQFSYKDPRVLVKNDWNPNEVTAEAMLKLRNSIEENGHIRPILVREIEGGSLEIVGGEHRCEISIDLGHDTVPTLNLGPISDKEAKKILLLDNSRYGEDDIGKLSSLLDDIGTAKELAAYMTYTEDDLSSLMSGDDSDIDDLEDLDELSYLDDEDEEFTAPVKDVRTHQTMKLKVDMENADVVKDVIDAIAKEQGIEDSDALVRSGEALTWLVRDYMNRHGIEEAAPMTVEEVDEMIDLDELDGLEGLEGLDELEEV